MFMFSMVRPMMKQIKGVHADTNTLAYLYSATILSCNLKPDNIGFYSMGVAKLFNIGLAIRTPENAVLGIGLGYSLPVDVYSYEVLINLLSQNAMGLYHIICRRVQ